MHALASSVVHASCASSSPELKFDLNQDGKSDLLWINPATGRITAWIMSGVSRLQSVALLTDPAYRIVATPDLNGDGKCDLIVRDAPAGRVVAWLMNGPTKALTSTLVVDPALELVATPDLNGDGKSDLIWYDASTGQTSAWLMNGLTRLSATLLLTHPSYRVVATPDLNGDGRSDLLWYSLDTGQTTAWLMNGVLKLSSARLYTHPRFKVTATPDLDGDGRSDLIWQDIVTGQTSAWLMNGTEWVAHATLLRRPEYTVIASPDLDGDGRSDLVWFNATTGRTVAWLMDGLQAKTKSVLPSHATMNVVGTPDLDGNGKSDLLWFDRSTGKTSAWSMNGTTVVSDTLLYQHAQYRPHDPQFRIKGGTLVSGNLAGSATWTPDQSPIILTDRLGIPGGMTLGLAEGVEVIGNGHRIQVAGTLDVAGTPASTVRLQDVHVQPAGSLAARHLISVRHAVVSRSSIYAATGLAIYGNLTISDSWLDLTDYIYLWYPIGDAVIQRNYFSRGSIGYGFRGGDATVTIRNNSFSGGGQGASAYLGASIENWANYGGVSDVSLNTFRSTTGFALAVNSAGAINAARNYWGTTNPAVIARMIGDKNDDLTKPGPVNFTPMLTEADPATPR